MSAEENIMPLGDPAIYPFSRRQFSGNCAGAWNTWYVESHIQRLYERCDLLLAEIERLKRDATPNTVPLPEVPAGT